MPADPRAIGATSGGVSARARELNNRGFALIGEGQAGRAVALLREAIRLDPGLAGPYNNLGIALQVMGEDREAAAAYRAAIAREPGSFAARVNMGNLLRDRLHDHAGAAVELREAMALRPGDAAILTRLAQALEWDGRPAEAAETYDRFVRDFPEAAGAAIVFERGLLKLKLGDFAAGWPALQRRHEAPGAAGNRILGVPEWRGEPIDGWLSIDSTRDGYGDALMAIRFAAEARRRSSGVVLLCRPEEARLLGRCDGIDRVATEPAELPIVAARSTVLGLAAALEVTPETLRGDVPYLSTDDETTVRWRQALAAVPGRIKIGICWRGNRRHADDARRSFRLEELAPMAAVPDVSLVSLQKGDGCEELAGAGFPVADLGFAYQVGDWLDTAAIVGELDLVVSADSAVAHCAGGAGRPTWVALPDCAEWRWLVDRDDSPWYSGVRLFRQSTRGDWAGVFGRMAEALRERLDTAGALQV